MIIKYFKVKRFMARNTNTPFMNSFRLLFMCLNSNLFSSLVGVESKLGKKSYQFYGLSHRYGNRNGHNRIYHYHVDKNKTFVTNYKQLRSEQTYRGEPDRIRIGMTCERRTVVLSHSDTARVCEYVVRGTSTGLWSTRALDVFSDEFALQFNGFNRCTSTGPQSEWHANKSNQINKN